MQVIRSIAAAAATGLGLHLRRYGREWVLWLVGLTAVASGAYWYIAPPSDFPGDTIIVIAPGASAPEVVEQLSTARLVRSPELLRFLLRVTGKSTSLRTGAYRFASPENMLVVGWRIAYGYFGIPPIRITVIEGWTVHDIAARVESLFPEISRDAFISAAQPYEGYLFPDTYVFQPDATAESVVEEMRRNFREKTDALAADVAASGHTLSDIVTLASIIEEEVRTSSDRRLVSSVMWNRITRGMPLQVDAVFGYIYGRGTYSPSYEDLKIDSPYNTYKYKGLPPGPISNPGLDSIVAAIHPTPSPYLFYLSDRTGVTHYSRTYAEHLANQNRHLR